MNFIKIGKLGKLELRKFDVDCNLYRRDEIQVLEMPSPPLTLWDKIVTQIYI